MRFHHFIGCVALCLSGLSGPASVTAQTSVLVDESRAVIPRVRVIRPSDTQTPAAQTPAREAPAATEDAAATRQQVRVRTLAPPTDITTDRARAGDGEAAGDETLRWQRERDRRFTVAPQPEKSKTEEAPETGEKPVDKQLLVPIRPTRTGLKEGARIRQLDKMTGQSVTFDLEIGQQRQVDRLMVELHACRAPNDNAAHGSMAFLRVWDTRRRDAAPDFTGWMFAESPALSALDHPRYDLWVISCTTSEG